MYEHNALGYRLGLALCLTKVRSSRARCPATALIVCILCCLKEIYKTTCNFSENAKFQNFVKTSNSLKLKMFFFFFLCRSHVQ